MEPRTYCFAETDTSCGLVVVMNPQTESSALQSAASTLSYMLRAQHRCNWLKDSRGMYTDFNIRDSDNDKTVTWRMRPGPPLVLDNVNAYRMDLIARMLWVVKHAGPDRLPLTRLVDTINTMSP